MESFAKFEHEGWQRVAPVWAALEENPSTKLQGLQAIQSGMEGSVRRHAQDDGPCHSHSGVCHCGKQEGDDGEGKGERV